MSGPRYRPIQECAMPHDAPETSASPEDPQLPSVAHGLATAVPIVASIRESRHLVGFNCLRLPALCLRLVSRNSRTTVRGDYDDLQHRGTQTYRHHHYDGRHPNLHLQNSDRDSSGLCINNFRTRWLFRACRVKVTILSAATADRSLGSSDLLVILTPVSSLPLGDAIIHLLLVRFCSRFCFFFVPIRHVSNPPWAYAVSQSTSYVAVMSCVVGL